MFITDHDISGKFHFIVMNEEELKGKVMLLSNTYALWTAWPVLQDHLYHMENENF